MCLVLKHNRHAQHEEIKCPVNSVRCSHDENLTRFSFNCLHSKKLRYKGLLCTASAEVDLGNRLVDVAQVTKHFV